MESKVREDGMILRDKGYGGYLGDKAFETHQ